MTDGSAPPALRAVESEAAVIAACLQPELGDLTDRACAALEPANFSDRRLGFIFAAHRELRAERVESEPAAVIEVLRRRGELEAAGGATHVLELEHAFVSAENLPHHVSLVLEAEQRRRIVARADAARAAALDARQPIERAVEALRDAAAAPEAPRGPRAALEALDVAALLPPILEDLDKPFRRMRTGWPKLDAFLSDHHGAPGGFVVPSIALLGAEPKAGKSTFAAITAERHAAAGGTVYYLDQENGRARFWRRALARRAKLGGARFGDVLALDEHRRRDEARRWATGLGGRFFYDDTRRVRDGAELRARVLALRDRVGDGALLVIADSMQKLPLEDLRDRRAGVDTWLRALEGIRDDAEAVILVISELARPQGSGGYRDSRRLKESGDAEYTGDVVMMLTRAAGEAAEGEPPRWGAAGATWKGPAFNLSVDYNRDGATGNVASYRSVFPFYEFDEAEPVQARPPKIAARVGARPGSYVAATAEAAARRSLDDDE